MKTPWIILFATLIAGAAPGCGGSPEVAACDQRCACEGCSEGARRSCIDDYDAAFRAADFRGCVDLYDDLLHCEEATGTCIGTDWKSSCGQEKDRLDHCTKQ